MTAFRTILAELADPFAEVDSIRHDHNVYQLATLADCYSPDGDDSPGAKFLASVARDVAERFDDDSTDAAERAGILGDLTDGDAAHEIADGAVPIYTHDLWQTFADLGAYNEDPAGEGFASPEDGLSKLAGVALYLIASRLVAALAEELREALDDEAETGERYATEQGDDEATDDRQAAGEAAAAAHDA